MESTTQDQEQARNDLHTYTRAMMAGNIAMAIAIEKRHGLYGYPPDIVCSALANVIDGKDADEALDDILKGKSE